MAAEADQFCLVVLPGLQMALADLALANDVADVD